MDWKKSLDRYLTIEPDDGFNGYLEQVLDKVSEPCYSKNEDYFDSADFTDWVYKQFISDTSIEVLAQIIEEKYHLNPPQ